MIHLICLVSVKQGNSIEVSAHSVYIYHEDILIFFVTMFYIMILFYCSFLYIVLIVEGLMED